MKTKVRRISSARAAIAAHLRHAMPFLRLAFGTPSSGADVRFKRAVLGYAVLSFFATTGHAAEILISKADRTLRFVDGRTVRTFPIALGLSPVGAKAAQGDRRTPEGEYFVTHKNAKSRFYLSIGISYPNAHDAEVGYKAGALSKSEYAAIRSANERHLLPPQSTKLGGDIFIHGGGTAYDWTWGCIALSDSDMLFLFRNVSVGDTVKIVK